LRFSVLHPTARTKAYPSFPSGWLEACWHWYRTCLSPQDVEYILTVHESRVDELWEQLNGSRGFFGREGARIPDWGRFTIVVNHGRDCLVDQSNEALKAAQGEILIWCEDDMFAPLGWDGRLSALVPDSSEPISLHCLTGSKRDNKIFIPCCYTKALADAIGPASPEYESMFIDDETTWKQRNFGRVVETGLVFEHRHPIFGTAKSDEVYQRENRHEAYVRGLAVFQKRRAAGFPYVELPGFARPGGLAENGERRRQESSEPAVVDPPLLALCTPGNQFSGQWQDALLNLGLRLGDEGWAVKRYRAYYSNVYSTRIAMAEQVISEAKESGHAPKYVLWIDDDNIVLPDQMMGLIRFLDHYPKVDGIVGWCWIHKAGGWMISAGKFWPEDGVHFVGMSPDQLFAGASPEEKLGPKVIEHTGFPCVLLRYSSMERLGAAAFRPLTKADLPALFGDNQPPAEPVHEWFASEDTAWCLRARYQGGFTLVVDPGCKVGHLKEQLQEPDVVKVGGQERADLKLWRSGMNGDSVVVPGEYPKSDEVLA